MDSRADLVVDTSALVAILTPEDDAHRWYQRLLASQRPIISAANQLELLMVLSARRPHHEQTAFRLLARASHLEVVPVDAAMSDLAFDAFLRFGKGRHPAKLNFGDCFSYVLACRLRLPLLFKGNDFSQTDILSAC